MNCLESRELFQRRLDGSPLKEGHLALDRHLADCRDCRELHVASQILLDNLQNWSAPRPPEGLANRIRRAADVQRRQLQQTRFVVTVGSVAASLLFVSMVTYLWNRPQPDALVVHIDTLPTSRPASLQQSVQDAGLAVVALTRRTADETVGQSRLLLPAMFPESPLTETPIAQISLQASTQSLIEAKDGMSAGLEPVANSARRALDLFLREIPPIEKKPKS